MAPPKQTRLCRMCSETDETKFYHYRAFECKSCTNARTGARQRGNTKLHRARHLKRAYGITPEFYDGEFEKQHGLCALCGLPPDNTDLQPNLVVDHDHKTGEFRGLVHGRCNSILGYAQENPIVLQAAIVYISRHRK